MIAGVSVNQYPKHKKCEGKLLIVAGGRCVWDDISQLNVNNYDVMCVNDIIMHFPYRINHAYSNDHIWLPKWIAARRPRYVKDFHENIVTHTCGIGSGSMSIWPWPGHGTSSLNACYTGLALGYDEIVLAGAPLDDSGHYFDPPDVRTNFIREVPARGEDINIPRYWQGAVATFAGRVKSLSGRTKNLLGGL